MAAQIQSTGLSGGNGERPKSALDQLIKNIKSSSQIEGEVGYLTTVDKLKATGVQKSPREMSPEYASELAKQLGQSLYVVDLDSRSLYRIHEKGIDFEPDAERKCALLYTVANRTFSKRQDFTGYA